MICQWYVINVGLHYLIHPRTMVFLYHCDMFVNKTSDIISLRLRKKNSNIKHRDSHTGKKKPVYTSSEVRA